jgi:aquaglyceroporin related protein, other eukaryote
MAEKPIEIPTTYAEHGTAIDHSPPESSAASGPELRWSRFRAMFQDEFSEFFGVFVMLLFGDGVVAQVVLSDGEKGSYQSITWGKTPLLAHVMSANSLP